MFSALWFCNRRFGACSGTRAPQYLLQALHSGDLIPILSLECGSEDDFRSAWTSGDFVFFAAGPGLRKLSALERFNFLGQWMARAYVIAGLGYSLASFHSVIYESLVAGHAAKPLPLPNAYQDRFLCQPKCTSGGLRIVSGSRSRKPGPHCLSCKLC